MPGVGERRRLIDGLMRSGIESHRWAVKSLDGKAKAVLTAGTIVLGVAMGGIGAIAGLGGDIAPNGRLLALPPNVACMVVGSLVAVFLSVLFAVLALKVVKVRGFGNPETFMGKEEDRADRGLVNDWIEASDEEVYGQVYDARLREMRSLEGQGAWMGRWIKCSQASLIFGLGLSIAWAPVLIFA